VKQIAQEVGVSERHCSRILDERKATRSNTSPSEGEGLSNASATKLLDRLQTTMGDIAAIARAKSGPHDTGAILRVEILLGEAEQDIEELRRRSELLTPMNDITTTDGGAPPSETDMS
jgi:hypothetical protein